MQRFSFLKSCLAILLTCLLSFSSFSEDLPTFNMTPGVTPISHAIYDLHMTIFWICVAIGVVVFSVLIYALLRHRKSIGHKAASFHSSLKVELLWALIPLIILILMAIPATLVMMRMHDNSKADLNIKVVGHQWKWEYDYLGKGIHFFSNLSTPRSQIEGKTAKEKWYLLQVDKPLVVPIHKKIRFLVTSNDVIHSWWVPALGIKRDAIPGFIHEAWARIDKPGTYRGQCAELCGINHGFMPIVVIAKTQEDFDKWVAAQVQAKAKPSQQLRTLTKEELMKKGEAIYKTHCAACHKPDGSGMPPAFPALKGGAITTGPAAQHIDLVLFGKPGTSMQAFKDQLNDEELAAVITYERNEWGNNTKGRHSGGLIQPADVKKARNKAT